MHSSDINEKAFLLKNVMQVNVLTYAESFKSFDFSDFLVVIEEGERFAQEVLAPLNQAGDRKGVKLHQNIIKTPTGFKAAWQKTKKQAWAKICAPVSYGGQGFPDSVGIAVQDAFFAANPAFYYYLMQTVEVAKLINQFGDLSQKEQFCQKLFNCDWSGCFSLDDTRAGLHRETGQTIATPEADYYLITGTKEAVVAAFHDLTDNCIHVVQAIIPGKKKTEDRMGLFIVPILREEAGALVDNNIRLNQIRNTIGIKGSPSCTLTYGDEGTCRGYLIEGIAQNRTAVLAALDSFRLQIALQGAAMSGPVTNFAIDYVNQDKQNRDTDTPGLYQTSIKNPHVIDAIMQLKSISEGVRGAVYMAAFYNDCLLQGADQQKEFFSDLMHLYSKLMKVYATESGLQAINQGIRILGEAGYTDEYFLEQSYRDLKAGTVIGSLNDAVSEEFLNDILLSHDGRMVNNLIKQFESIEAHTARTEALREAIYVWQDYIGGIIVLMDDLKTIKQAEERQQKLLFAGNILKFFGDVVLCYHLIGQGLEAEKIMEEAGLNFYNLKDEVMRKPEFRKWYNKLIQAEYFALNILSLQEAAIHVMQRNSNSALDAILEVD